MAYSTDTRTLQSGDTFVAIPGDRYDGHDFVREALKQGAALAVVERPVEGVEASQIKIVADTTVFLAKLARARVRQSGCTVVAITGSMGKTTTKNAIAAVLKSACPVVASSGNLNTLLGLSLTLVNQDFDAKTKLVLEMGASAKGDIAAMCAYFKPDISVVTNIRGVHLETFGTLEGVQQAKGELVRALGNNGLACLNGDDPLSAPLSAWCAGRSVTYGVDSTNDITPADITATLPLLGKHVMYVAMAAYAVGRAFGMTRTDINDALGRLEPEKGRLCRLKGRNGAILIDDSYNSSPDAMQSALEVVKDLKARRRIVFMGDMLELGSDSVMHHSHVIQQALAHADQVIVVGSIGQKATDGLPHSDGQSVQVFEDSTQVAQLLDAGKVYTPRPGDLILVKGSQGSRMERISRALLDKTIDPTTVLPRHTPAWLAI